MYNKTGEIERIYLKVSDDVRQENHIEENFPTENGPDITKEEVFTL